MSSKQTNQQFYGHYWNDNTVKYLDQSAGSRWFKYLLGELLKEMPASRVKSIADIGCGVGNKTAHMARHFKKAKITGYDFSEAGIKVANKNFKSGKLSFANEDITKSKHRKKFDLISAFEVLEHIDDWQTLTKKLIEANNHYMLISTPVGRMRPYEVHIGHYRNFKRGEIEAFMESEGYRTVKTFYAGFPFYSPIIRDLTNLLYKAESAVLQSEMSFLSKRMHDVWYFLFRYCSLKHRGDTYIGLFEKASS